MKMDVHQAVELLVNSLFPRFSDASKFLHVHLEATYTQTIKGRRRE
jgi:hypothetical protein